MRKVWLKHATGMAPTSSHPAHTADNKLPGYNREHEAWATDIERVERHTDTLKRYAERMTKGQV
jgi:hypothetical protein